MTKEELEQLKTELKAEIKKEEHKKYEEDRRRKEWARNQLEYLIQCRDSKVAEWNDSYRKEYSKKVDDFRHFHGL